MSWQPEIDELRRREELAGNMGGAEKVAKHRSHGKMTVRDRIATLLDAGSFHEIGALAGKAEYEGGELRSFVAANYIYGTGRIDGRKVVVGGDDFTIRGGAADAGIRGKQIHAEQTANSLRVPMVRLVDGTGGGGSVKTLERSGATYVPANPAWNYVIDNMSLVPVVAACLGSVAGLGAAKVVTSHFSIMVEPTAQLFTAGPPVVKFGTGENLSKEELGGAQIHRKSGAVDVIVGSEQEAFDQVRRFLSYLPSNVHQAPPVQFCQDPVERREEKLLAAVPKNRRQPVRIRPVMQAVFDTGSVFELARYGGPIVTALARLDGHPVGVIASDAMANGGVLTVQACDAMIRLVDLCQTFHLPVVVLTDIAGIAVGTLAERQGTIRYAARAIAAVYQATVPTAEILVRKCFGVGGAGMTNRHGYVQRYAWPSGDWGSLPIEGGLEAAYRSELEASDDPQALLEEIRGRLEAVRSPFRTAEAFGVEEIIDPRDTRPLLCEFANLAAPLRTPGQSFFTMRP
ncbi:MAG TPA: carboxyl transferase domain-containing protein [Acetobacteraceae bacterium]